MNELAKLAIGCIDTPEHKALEASIIRQCYYLARDAIFSDYRVTDLVVMFHTLLHYHDSLSCLVGSDTLK